MFTVVHLFAGSGGCTLGFQRAGFRSLGSFDLDPKACIDLGRLTSGPAHCRDLAVLPPEELRALTGACPEVVVMSPPCKSFSGCMPEARAGETKYQDMSRLALWGVDLALRAWSPDLPAIILLENVPRIQTRGAKLLGEIVELLQKAGYTTDQRTHDCGELGGLAQRRERFLLVARHMERCPDVLRKPPLQRVRSVGEVLGQLPSPAATHGDELHRLPLLSALNWLRLAAIRAGKDWRDLPAAIRLGGDERARHSGIYGVEDAAAPAHTVTANARPGATWGAVADPRVGWDPAVHGGRPDSYGVGSWSATSPTVRGRSDIQTSRGSIADPRLAESPTRFKGKYGVGGWDADPRLGCEPRDGAFGERPSGVVIGHHRHDSPASVADPRLSYRSAERVAQADRREAGRGHSGRGDFGVLDPAAPAPTIRARHEVRQAPAAVVDDRGWPVPTHDLVREGEELVLYGPELDLSSARPVLLVIRAPDGTWHRPLTDRELATLQGFPLDCKLEGPSSSSRKGGAGRREHIGNAIPPPTAEAIAREVAATLLASAAGGFRLAAGDVWVQPEEAATA